MARIDVAYVHDIDAATHGARAPQVLRQVLTETLPTLRRLQEEGAGEAEIASARQASVLASMATLAVSIAILLLAAMLGSDWSKMGSLR